PEGAALRALHARLGLGATVKFLGDVSAADLAVEYVNADCFCLPSAQEGFGIVFLEAMTAGLPVVACRAAAVPEVVADGVSGLLDPATGRVIDLSELKRVVGEVVVERFDHADLNADPLFRGRVPTTENIAIAVWDLVVPKLGRERVWQVRVWEDPTLYVDYRG